jgi:iron complex transport system substrate-binding protein
MLKIKVITIIISVFFVVSCHYNQRKQQGRTITDMPGRKVEVPDTINRIVGIRSGTLRLLACIDAVPFIKGIEKVETRSMKPYNMAYPELALLPVTGPMHGGNAELITALKPDVIFSTYLSVSEGDELQYKTGIPVIALKYRDP